MSAEPHRLKKGDKIALKSDAERSSAHITLRVREDQKVELFKKAKALGMTLKDYLLEGKQ